MLAHNRGDDRPIKCPYYLWLPYFMDSYIFYTMVGGYIKYKFNGQWLNAQPSTGEHEIQLTAR